MRPSGRRLLHVARVLPIFIALTLACARPAAGAAPPQLLVVGGGWGPEGTQASIEKHVLDVQAGLGRSSVVLFAAGSGPSPSVQSLRADTDEPGRILGLIFDRSDNLAVTYRPTQVRGAQRASKQGVLRALAQLRKRGDVILIGVGHGAPSSDEQPAALELWGPRDRLTVPELAERVDAAPDGGRLALVLGHCHSGAFADVMFTGADADVGLAHPTRCVLAAVPGDREAAGCTPDLDDPGARAYVASFADALGHITRADLNRDGALSLAEAHAHARIEDGTVDVPVRTSELWLERRLGERAPDVTQWRRAAVLAKASADERAVLQAVLPKSMAQAEPKAVATTLDRLAKDSDALDAEVQDLLDRRERIRRVLVDAVLSRWPELANPYHARARQLLAGDAAQVVTFAKARPELRQLDSMDRSIAALDRQLLGMHRRAARLERWLRSAQRVVNEATLRAGKDAAKIAALDALVACESMVLKRK